MLKEEASNLEQARRFRNEAQSAPKLQHPNTIRVFGFDQANDGELLPVTELLSRVSSSMILSDKGVLAPVRALHILCQVLESLAEAHEHRIVHRDLEPDNNFVGEVHGEPDSVKVLDLGIAKVLQEGAGGEGPTETGVVMGTATQMSPEQAQGLPVDGRSDLSSAGVLRYRMVTGRAPFSRAEIT